MTSSIGGTPFGQRPLAFPAAHGEAVLQASARAKHPLEPIFELPHFKLDYVAIDALHALDLGFSQDVVGNVVWEFIGSVAEGRNLDLEVKYVWALLQKHYSEMKTAQ